MKWQIWRRWGCLLYTSRTVIGEPYTVIKPVGADNITIVEESFTPDSVKAVSYTHLLRSRHLPATAAARTGRRLRALFRACTVASLARLPAGNADRFFTTENSFLEINRQIKMCIRDRYRCH